MREGVSYGKRERLVNQKGGFRRNPRAKRGMEVKAESDRAGEFGKNQRKRKGQGIDAGNTIVTRVQLKDTEAEMKE